MPNAEETKTETETEEQKDLTSDEIEIEALAIQSDSDEEDDSDLNLALLDKVQEFCMSPAFENQFDEFAKTHADLFIPFVDAEYGAEHQLEFHDCFTEYLETFEGKIKKFIESIEKDLVAEGEESKSSVDDFYEECRIALDKLSAFHPKRFFIEALLATTEYPIFFTLMMGEARNRKNLADQEKAKSGGDRK